MASTLVEVSDNGRRWLGQFALGDRGLATELLRGLELVSRDEFADGLRALILERAEEAQGPVALYAERELGHRHGVPHRLFKETDRKPKRALGSIGPPAVKATKAYDISVGSEGIVAQLISEFAREHPKKFVDHPGPDQIRRKRVKNFWIVTDMVGSGDRVWRYLEAAWLVRSVRSWWSGGFLRFGVIAYAGTAIGERRVVRHESKPTFMLVKPAPTIRTVFSAGKAEQLERLCEAYVPAATVGRYLLGLARQGRFMAMPVVTLLDEAHQFLDKSVGDEFSKTDLDAFGLIAKEGRKYSLTCVLATQRPRDIPEDVLSQMGMFIVHRLINERDRNVVEKACGDLDASAAAFLPTLGQGEAMVVGVSSPMPLPVAINRPTRPPSSSSADYENLWG